MIQIKFDTADVHKYMDSRHNMSDIMSVEALIDNKKATIYIGDYIRITNGHVTVAYEGKEYDTVYGECVNNEVENEIISMIQQEYNVDDIYELINSWNNIAEAEYYEVNIDPECVDFDNMDEWGAAFLWYSKYTGVEYNLCYENGKCYSAIYYMERDDVGFTDTDTSMYEHYEIDFSDKYWERKLLSKMVEAIHKFFKELRNERS